ncbi:toxic anion resistance protein [Sphingomonas sp. NPDC079357]|uniref:toxic anion resistance protein n=1 Tax=Sphingomonas sp. NPDC079357 TaxID=3364518 RepID=UPI00384B3725
MSERDARIDARALLRQWLALTDAEVTQAIDALGRRAIAAAAEASARLPRISDRSQAAERGLRDLEALARAIEAPPPRRGLSVFARAPKSSPPPVEAIVEQLDRERDAVVRTVLAIESDRTRFRAAADALDGALALVRACATAIEAAAREIAPDRPERARFLREVAAPRLLAREQDLAVQAAVTEQGLLTLAVYAENQGALAQALGRARDTSVAALRTAVAAREAVASGTTLAAQAAALDRTASAVADASAARPALSRALDDAIAQARRAVAARDRS